MSVAKWYFVEISRFIIGSLEVKDEENTRMKVTNHKMTSVTIFRNITLLNLFKLAIVR